MLITHLEIPFNHHEGLFLLLLHRYRLSLYQLRDSGAEALLDLADPLLALMLLHLHHCFLIYDNDPQAISASPGDNNPAANAFMNSSRSIDSQSLNLENGSSRVLSFGSVRPNVNPGLGRQVFVGGHEQVSTKESDLIPLGGGGRMSRNQRPPQSNPPSSSSHPIPLTSTDPDQQKKLTFAIQKFLIDQTNQSAELFKIIKHVQDLYPSTPSEEIKKAVSSIAVRCSIKQTNSNTGNSSLNSSTSMAPNRPYIIMWTLKNQQNKT